LQALRRAGKFLVSNQGQVFIAAVIAGIWSFYYFRHHAVSVPHNFHDLLDAATGRGFPPGMVVSILMFIAFSLYWDAAAKNASAAKTSESPMSRGLHLTLVSAAQILVFAPVPGLRARFLPDSTPLIVAALVLELVSFAMAIWARQFLGRNWSGAVTTKVDHELVRSGPYRWVRHPIYTGILGVYFSTALVSGEIHGLIGTAVAVIAYWRKIGMEEHYLRGEFGPAYDTYRTQTWAVIPGMW
jgi:protein-S-isoprenylcysteine O-methyltransferase Ste14